MLYIGITISDDISWQGQRLRRDYLQRIWQAGGLPIMLPNPPENASAGVYRSWAGEYGAILDGLLLSGGGDFPPQWNGSQSWVPPVSRDCWEWALLRMARQQNWPVLGICRGWQGLALALGGRLCPELPNGRGVAHQQTAPRQQVSHRVQLRGLLRRLYGRDTLMVNSFHHQAVSELPPGWSWGARAADGVIEGAAAPEGFLVGVQWHPEALGDQVLFNALLSAAAEGKRG